MFSLTVVFGQLPATFLFRTAEKVQIVSRDLSGGSVQTLSSLILIEDDFGQTARINLASIHGWIVEDMEQSKHAWAERMLHQARAQSIGQNLAASDLSLRNMATRQGPAIINPMMGMNGR